MVGTFHSQPTQASECASSAWARSWGKRTYRLVPITFLSITIALVSPFLSSRAFASPQELDVALMLADILRSSRVEIASQQASINNPDIGDKGLTGDVIVSNVLQRLAESDVDISALEDGSFKKQLVDEQLAAMKEIADENQALINRKGIGFKGFVPAVFAQLVNERFGQKVGDRATIKVTAPVHLVRNRKARPDRWELNVIETKFSDADWVQGQLYSEIAEGES